MIPDGGGPTLMDLADMVKQAGGFDVRYCGGCAGQAGREHSGSAPEWRVYRVARSGFPVPCRRYRGDAGR